MDHSKHIPLQRSEITAAKLVDARIYDSDDNKIGTISDARGIDTVTSVVLDVGGFLGIGAKPVLLDVDQLNLMCDMDCNMHGVTYWTKEELKNLPSYKD